ncbi:hypothetical protein Egran_03854 [Elaphomyces granulatus]|uniref:DASH complex subunit DAD1 n=1 Tax=Elaphomyces granulatus TaxID=519963 RepID=A0A232LW95_9EURO|nr:hypothetical protein Egran_03854 [Elaphomyces granulatus]
MSASGPKAATPTVFEQQRLELVKEIAVARDGKRPSKHQPLKSEPGKYYNCKTKNVGNEFSSVEALWSQFENFMGKDGDGEAGEEGKREERGQEEGEADNTQLEEGDGAGK